MHISWRCYGGIHQYCESKADCTIDECQKMLKCECTCHDDNKNERIHWREIKARRNDNVCVGCGHSRIEHSDIGVYTGCNHSTGVLCPCNMFVELKE